jgi:ubiquinone/menaquinone biosynthesis C-methylase UbiE
MAYEAWLDRKDPWASLARMYGVQERMERPSIRALVELAQPTRGDSVIDLATGTGLVARALLQHPDPPGSFVGVDLSQAMLDRVGELPSGWSVRIADALRTGLDPHSASLVTSAWLLHLLDPAERLTALQEMRRLLAPDGRAVLIVPSGTRPHGIARAAAPITRFVARRRGLHVLQPVAQLHDLIDAAGLACQLEVTTIDGWPARVLLLRHTSMPTRPEPPT